MTWLRRIVLRWRFRWLARRASKAFHRDAIDRIKTGRPYVLPFSDETFAELSRAMQIPERFLRGDAGKAKGG